MAVLMEVMEVRMALVAEGVVLDLEDVVVEDMIEVLTEVAEVGQEEEGAWGKCLKYLSCLSMSPGLKKVHIISKICIDISVGSQI